MLALPIRHTGHQSAATAIILIILTHARLMATMGRIGLRAAFSLARVPGTTGTTDTVSMIADSMAAATTVALDGVATGATTIADTAEDMRTQAAADLLAAVASTEAAGSTAVVDSMAVAASTEHAGKFQPLNFE